MILRAVVSSMVLLAASPALAITPSQICSGDPCVVDGDVLIDAGGSADFGSELRVRAGARVLLATSDLVELRAGHIVVEGRAQIRALVAGVDLVVGTTGGTIEIGDPERRARLDLRDARSVEVHSGSVGGVAGELFVNAVIDARSSRTGGSVYLSGSTVTVAGRVRVDAKRDGGDFVVEGESLVVDAPISANGEDGGVVEIDAYTGSAEVRKPIRARGRGEFCFGGGVRIYAERPVALSDVDVSGRAVGCIGGDIDVFSPEGISSKGTLTSRGGIRDGSGGFVGVASWGPLTVDGIQASGGSGGDVALEGQRIDVLGSVVSQGAGGDFGWDGTVDLLAECGLRIAPRARLDTRHASEAFFEMLLESGGTIDIAGTVTSSGEIEIVHPAGIPPMITGRVSPSPTFVVGATAPCG